MVDTILLAAEQMAETAGEAMQEAGGHGQEILPEALHFLQWGWWVVHLVGIPVVFFIGMAVGKGKKGGAAGAH